MVYTYIILLKPYAASLPRVVIVILIFQAKKFREVIFARNHTARGWWSQDSNPSLSGSKSPAYNHCIILTTLATTQAQPVSTFPHC